MDAIKVWIAKARLWGMPAVIGMDANNPLDPPLLTLTPEACHPPNIPASDPYLDKTRWQRTRHTADFHAFINHVDLTITESAFQGGLGDRWTHCSSAKSSDKRYYRSIDHIMGHHPTKHALSNDSISVYHFCTFSYLPHIVCILNSKRTRQQGRSSFPHTSTHLSFVAGL